MLCLKTIQNYFHLSIFKAGLLGSARKWHGIKMFCVKIIVVCLGTIVAGHFIKVFCLKLIVVVLGTILVSVGIIVAGLKPIVAGVGIKVFCFGNEAGTAWPPLLTRAGHGWHGLC